MHSTTIVHNVVRMEHATTQFSDFVSHEFTFCTKDGSAFMVMVHADAPLPLVTLPARVAHNVRRPDGVAA